LPTPPSQEPMLPSGGSSEPLSGWYDETEAEDALYSQLGSENDPLQSVSGGNL
jgi:hypothetical protein